MKLRDLILNIFQAVGIMLVFVTVLFGLKYPKIKEALCRECPEGRRAKDRFKFDLKSCLVNDCLPVLFATLISAYVLLPLAFKLISTKKICLWDLDMLPFAYVTITALLIVLLMWTVLLGFRLIRRIITIK